MSESEPRIRRVYTPGGSVGLFFSPEEDMSLADQVAHMSEEDRERVLAGVNMEELEYDPEFWLRPSQLALANSTTWMTVALAGRGWGKASLTSSPVPTVSGWSTIGDIKPGDKVFGPDGHPRLVVAKSEVFPADKCYEVVFSDHTSVVVNADHEWAVETVKRPKSLIIDTQMLYETHRTTDKRKAARYRIPMNAPLQLPAKDLPLDPYVLGVWLGDGTVGETCISSHNGEAADLWKQLENRGYTSVQTEAGRHVDSRIVTSVSGLPPLEAVLTDLRVLDHKHIPQQYLRASVEQRMELLRGLCDADGYIDPSTGKIEITKCDSRMSRDISELLSTLGFKHSVNAGSVVVDGHLYARNRIIFHAYSDTPVFYIGRKRDRQKARPDKQSQSVSRYITDVIPVDPVPTQCIQVDAADGLFLIGEKMVTTHNSHVLSTAMHQYAMRNPGHRLLLLGRTTSDVRDVMIHGSSGIMNVVNPAERPKYNPAARRLTWENGTTALCYSAERPDSLRGIQTHASFCDEVAAYRANPGAGLVNAFDQVKIATRLGDHPQIFVATTPKRVPMILDLVKQAEEDPSRVLLVRGPTSANKALSASYKETVEGLYAGTALGRQELEGELLTDVDGALLTQTTIDNNRIDQESEPLANKWWEQLPYRVIGVDPSVSSKPNDECGIVAVGATGERKMFKRTAFVLEDASMLAPPERWARKVVEMARKYRAVVVAEKNQGGELVRMVIQAEDPFVPVVLVHASVAKEERAEPVGTAYERGAVRHVDFFPELEAQLTSWAPGMGMASPDRMDALVHAVTALLVVQPKGMVGRVTVAGDPSKHHIPVRDHNPTNRYPEDRTYRDFEYEGTEEVDDGKQLALVRAGRRRHIPVGPPDNRRWVGYSAYSPPNRFGR